MTTADHLIVIACTFLGALGLLSGGSGYGSSSGGMFAALVAMGLGGAAGVAVGFGLVGLVGVFG